MKARIRLIDANKLQTTTTYFGISDTPVEVVKKSVIENAKTVEAVPMPVIEKINAEITKERDDLEETHNDYDGDEEATNIINVRIADMEWVLSVIDKAVKECTHERT